MQGHGYTLLVGWMAVGGNTLDGITDGTGGLTEDVIGLPDSGTIDSNERGGSDPKGAPAYNQATALTCRAHNADAHTISRGTYT